eukprot:1756792-Rhodomonas_salina.1
MRWDERRPPCKRLQCISPALADLVPAWIQADYSKFLRKDFSVPKNAPKGRTFRIPRSPISARGGPEEAWGRSPVMTRVLSLPGGRKSMGAAGEEVRKMAWPNALSGGGVVGGERRAASPTCRPGACFGQFAVRCPVLTSRFVVPASTWW